MVTSFPLSIVVADDNSDAAHSMADVLTLWGHDAFVCLDPQIALGYYTKFWPDVMLLDIGFPLRIDGLNVAREVKKLAKTKDTVLIAVTGFNDDETKQLAHEAGFDHYLVKPIDLQRLEMLLTEIVHQQVS